MSGAYESGRDLNVRRLHTEVLVIGSGASGAVVAAKLAEAGHDVLVVEEGERVTPEEYGRMRPSESLLSMWREGGSTAVFGVGRSPVINMTMGRCVGGSSVLTGGVCFRTPEYVLDHWEKELGLRELGPAGLEPYFDEVEEAVGVAPVPDSLRSRSTVLIHTLETLRWRSVLTLRWKLSTVSSVAYSTPRLA